MAKKLIQRYLPDPKSIQKNRYLRFLGAALYAPNLWHLNRHSAASAFFVGVFCAFLPIPFQMVIAACLAILLRCNLPLSISLVWISNPITMPAMFYFTYKVGCFMLKIPAHSIPLEFSLQDITTSLGHIWKPLYLGSIVFGLLCASLCYLLIRLYWRLHVFYHWRKRHTRTSSNRYDD